ncbi:MAG: TolC family protein [Elusimicrobia bacterium]|nr:TolC family protein [Elusimicrobiota bacterium]
MKKIVTVLICLFFGFNATLYAEYSLTLAEALKCAIANNELINASAKSKEVSQYHLKAARGKHYPNIYVEGSVNKLNDPIILTLTDARAAVIGASAATFKAATTYATGTPTPDPVVDAYKKQLEEKIPQFDMQFQDDLFYKLTAGVVWPLYTGGKIAANSQAKKAELAISEMEYTRTLNSTITSVIESYFRAKLAQEARDIRQDYLDDIIQHNENAQKLFKVGMISKANKLRAEVALAQATREYQKSERDLELAIVVLSNIIGVELDKVKLISDFKQIEDVKEAKHYEDIAYSNNITLKDMQQKKEMLNQKKRAIKGNFLPTIAAFGKYEIYKDNLTMFEPEWVAGLNARLDIFKGGEDYDEYKAYSKQVEVLDLYIQNANKMIDTAVKKYHHEAEAALEQYESLKSSQDLTEENLNLYKKSFKEGLATSIEVIDAELALEKVRLEQSQALFDFNVAYAKLIDICGNSHLLMDNIIGEDQNNEK